MLRCLPPLVDPRILAGREDDAAVYRVGPDLALIQTVDYITPVVDDPYTFGQVAAANALSDIYAMGGRPVLALNIVGFPNQSIPLGILEDILRGGADKAAEAGVSIAGGHSITDHAPKYGLCVTGFAHPERLVFRSGARAGDFLVLTKPLGIGVIATGIDRRLVDAGLETLAVRYMTALNREAAEVMLRIGVHACTDVTGFGLLGHLWEMAAAGGVGAEVEASRVPVIPGVSELVRAGAVAGGAHGNYRYARDRYRWEPSLSEEMRLLLCDPQTSGGLLMAVAPDKLDALMAALRGAAGAEESAVIGRLVGDRSSFRVLS